MPPTLRKLMLALHIAASVGWLGAVAAYLVLDLTVAASQDTATVQAALTGMGLLVSYLIVPLALATLVGGVIQSLGTPWGLARHWWVLISLLLTLFATAVLLQQASHISQGHLQNHTLLHSIGGLVVLLVITGLNVLKPPGRTQWDF
ncbi:MAG: hypothetical protein KIS80_02235 [Anaerolineales bacterium]|nr:hypothetical protein [Anaerolineales bacterium]